jgi:hypothetical protein
MRVYISPVRACPIFPFLRDGRVEKGLFYGVFADRAISSPRYLGVFSELFLKSKNAFYGEASISRRKRGFFSRVFADGRFLMFISSQGI